MLMQVMNHIYLDRLVIVVDVRWGLNLVVVLMVVVMVASMDEMKACGLVVMLVICLVF